MPSATTKEGIITAAGERRGKLNMEFWKKHRSTAYGEAEVKTLRDSHAKAMALIESLTDEELLEKNISHG